MELKEMLQTRVLRLDGAMGTEIQRYALSEADFRKGLPVEPRRDVKGDNECLNLSRPDVIRSIHQAYVEAGADILETNSFGANAIAQLDYGLADLAPQMAYEAARLAREVADASPRKVWVAGSMGPTSKSLSLVSDYLRPDWRPCSFDEMAAAYEAQARSLIRGGVDLLLIETCFDALNAKAALYGIHQVKPDFPVIVSVSVSSGFGRTLTGQSLEAFYAAVSDANLLAFGLNCSLGMEGLLPLVHELDRWCPAPLVCYPNAGLPNASGCYDETPERMAAHAAGLEGLVNIVGGCCGTTPAHIRALPELRPRPLRAAEKGLRISGLEAWTFDSSSDEWQAQICRAGHVGHSPEFAAFMEGQEYDEALMYLSEQLISGAAILDLCLDGLPDTPALMERFVRMIQSDPSVSAAALLIESRDWETILNGLKNAQGRCVAVDLSLETGQAPSEEKVAVLRSLGAAIAVPAQGGTIRIIP